ncbi:MAG: MarR family transcriptional regulator [Emcibacter sp.]|nr:MarR family transcriptional regulator [Emcibacter sp.]
MSEELFSNLGIGTRLRRVYDMLSVDMEKIYKEAGLEFRVRHFPVVFALHKLKGLTIAELQKTSLLTHSAISQTVKQLMENNIVEMKVGEDARSRIVFLTPTGEKLVEKLLPMWEMANKVIFDLREESHNDLLLGLNDFEENLRARGFYQRYQSYNIEIQRPEVEIVPFHVKYRKDWYDINKEWVEKYFSMEAADGKTLENPERHILAEGGEIYFALVKDEVLGAVGLKHQGNGEYELTKMGVRPKAQGLGIGGKLIEIIIDRFHARGGEKLYLETNAILKPAIALYEKYGFVQVESRDNTPYTRADVCMDYQGE